jgi:hypothetical protein
MELRKTWDDRFALLNHPYLHYGVVVLINLNQDPGEPTSWDASVEGPECVIIVGTNPGPIPAPSDFPVRLPPASGNKGKAFYVKKIDAGTGEIQIKAALGDSIDGVSQYDLTTQYEAVLIVSDGVTNWWILSKVV